MIRLLVGLPAALGIASVLVVSVVQKSKEIFILRATGATRRQILGVFLLQGALPGSLLGSVMGGGSGLPGAALPSTMKGCRSSR